MVNVSYTQNVMYLVFLLVSEKNNNNKNNSQNIIPSNIYNHVDVVDTHGQHINSRQAH